MLKDKHAFTLLEVMVVMVIVAVLLGLSISGTIQLKASIELKEAGRQISGTIDLLRNAARNDVRDNSITNAINFKGFRYSLDDQRLDSCVTTYSGSQVLNEWSCNYSEEIEQVFFNLQFSLNLEPGRDFGGTGFGPSTIQRCSYIFIESLTADILIANSSATPINNAKCVILFTDYGKNTTGYLVVDPITDTYQIFPDLTNVPTYL